MKRITPALMTIVICLDAANCLAQGDLAPTYKYLKDLEYFAGDWEWKGLMTTGDEKEELSVIASYRWIKNKAFMTATLQESKTKETVYVATFGWDPDKKHMMSWDFNFLGTIFSYYQGRTNEGWRVKGGGRMPDGATIDFSALFTFVDDNRMTYKGSGTRTKDGTKVPLTLEFTAKRIKK